MGRLGEFNVEEGIGPCRVRRKGTVPAGNGCSSGLFDRERCPTAGVLISPATSARVYAMIRTPVQFSGSFVLAVAGRLCALGNWDGGFRVARCS